MRRTLEVVAIVLEALVVYILYAICYYLTPKSERQYL
jgi:hypothetical protein